MADTSRDITEEEILQGFMWLHHKIGIPQKLLAGLSHGDSDWLFLIKWHAILETCFNQVLTAHFGREALGRIFSRLETSNPRIGKTAFAVALGIIKKDMVDFMQRLSEMRNHAVHHINNFDFTFERYFETEVTEAKDSWLNKICFSVYDMKTVSPETRQSAEKDLRFLIGFGCMTVCAHIASHSLMLEKDDDIKLAMEGALREFLAQHSQSIPKESPPQGPILDQTP